MRLHVIVLGFIWSVLGFIVVSDGSSGWHGFDMEGQRRILQRRDPDFLTPLTLRGAGGDAAQLEDLEQDLDDLSLRDDNAQERQLTEKEQKSVEEAQNILAELDRALDSFPSSSEEDEIDESIMEAATLFPQHLPSLYNKGCALHAAREYANALSSYEAALKCPQRPEWSTCRAHTLNNLGLLHHAVFHNATAAEKFYRQALELDAAHVHALTNYAVLLENPKKMSTRETVRVDLPAAEDMYNRALRTDPEHVPALVNFGYFQEQHRAAFEEAEALYEKALRLAPRSTFALRNLAAFLCNVREPYDPDTLMPVHFNKTCHQQGAFNTSTGLPLDPEVLRPVDRARALYNKVLEIRNPTKQRRDDEDEEGELLMHGVFCQSRAPPLPAAVDAQSAESAVEALRSQLAAAESVLLEAKKTAP